MQEHSSGSTDGQINTDILHEVEYIMQIIWVAKICVIYTQHV